MSDALPRYRKRTLFAHKAILKARSTFFGDMLKDGWMESSGTATGSAGKRAVVKIEDFSFDTVWWCESSVAVSCA